MKIMSKIEWTDKSWNPIIGCSKVSEGCRNCYAAKMAFRLAHMEAANFSKFGNHGEYSNVVDMDNQTWNMKTHLVEKALDNPKQWKKPKKIFVCSMGDLFHSSVPYEWIDKVFDVIRACPQHTFQILTKRPFNMSRYFSERMISFLPNVWVGVSVENQEEAYKRIPVLFAIRAVKRFVSIEPMLEAIDLTPFTFFPNHERFQVKGLDFKKPIDWVIVGGETGYYSRPIKKEWVDSIFTQCIYYKIPFFFKSWGGSGKKDPKYNGIVYREFPLQ